MKITKEYIIISILILLFSFFGTYFVFDKFVIPYIAEQQQLGFELGIYQTALDQTQNGRVFFINQNDTIAFIGVEDLCGGGG